MAFRKTRARRENDWRLNKASGMFDKVASPDGTISITTLFSILEKMNLEPNKCEQLEAIKKFVDPMAIPKKGFMWFVGDRCKNRRNANFNRLLVKPVIGKARHASYDLPCALHTYGQPCPRDAEGAGRVVNSWASFQGSQAEARQPDIVRMNRDAVKAGMVRAREMKKYTDSHMRYKVKASDIESATAAVEKKKLMESLRKRTFGVLNPTSEPMGSLITGDYNGFTQMAIPEAQYPRITGRTNAKAIKDKLKNVNSKRGTKASYGHAAGATARLDSFREAASPKELYKMARFKNVKSRLSQSARGIIMNKSI